MKTVVAIKSLEENPYFVQKASRIFGPIEYLPERPDRSTLELLLTQYEVLIIGAREHISGDMLHSEKLKTKVIGTLSVGTDHLDLAALAEHGVHVERCPTANVRSVAEHVITVLLALAKHIKLSDRLVAEGKSRPDLPSLPREVYGKTLGLVGFGNIGRTVAALGQALGMKITATSPSHHHGSDGYVTFYDIQNVLASSDFISVSVPLTQETSGLIDSERLGQIKEGAILINTSRAEVVVEGDICSALDSGKLSGYSGDYDHANIEMARRSNVILTPHIAGVTVESYDRLDNELIDRLEAYFGAG
jgi:phosphoglycerate dehydrogenase-like enzyme